MALFDAVVPFSTHVGSVSPKAESGFQKPEAPVWLSVKVRVTVDPVLEAVSFGGVESTPKSGAKDSRLMLLAVSMTRTAESAPLLLSMTREYFMTSGPILVLVLGTP